MIRGSFRRQLVTMIAVVMVSGAAGLILIQYLAVRTIVDSQVKVGMERLDVVACQQDPSECRPGVDLEASAPIPATGVIGIIDEAGRAVQEQTLIWSAVALVLFALVAIVVAHWLASKALQRVATITETTRSITAADRSARLNLGGSQDEIKDLADTIDGMLERLDHAISRQDLFLAAAAHELRTPAATIRTSLEVPSSQGMFPRSVEPAITRALNANAKTIALLEALAELSRIQLGDGVPSTGSLAAAATGAIAQFQELAAAHQVSVHHNLGGEQNNDEGNDLIEIAVANLVRNAIVHNHRDGQVWVTTDAQQVTVSNTGVQLTEVEVEELVHPFNRGSNTRIAGGGLGLGLTVVKAVAERFGGQVVLEPRGDGGLTVTLTFP